MPQSPSNNPEHPLSGRITPNAENNDEGQISDTQEIRTASVSRRRQSQLPITAQETRAAIKRERVEIFESGDSSGSIDAEIEWAEKALIFVTSDKHYKGYTLNENRAGQLEQRNPGIFDDEKSLEAHAQSIVNNRVAGGDSKAIYLLARWSKLNPTDQHGHFRTALSKGYSRAAYHVGIYLENEKDIKGALGYYRHGADADDIMSLLVSFYTSFPH
jgi:hypothetical protein